MSSTSSIATVALYPKHNIFLRLFALWYFTTLMTIWNVAGHTVLGFEQAWAAPIVAVLSACVTQILLEWIDAKANSRKPRFAGGVANFANFLPPAIISGFACAMLLYPNERVMPLVFAAVASIASKVLVRIPMPDGKWTHLFNPSNLGIIVTLVLFPSVGQAPPYHFTENIIGVWHWLLPGAILTTGIIVHGFATGRLPLCLAWLIGFFSQGIFRAWLFSDNWYVPLTPMSSAGFILFTLYMIPDPATTPLHWPRQIAFGLAVAAAYATLQMNHIVYGLFFALAFVCVIRGILISLFFQPAVKRNSREQVGRGPAPVTQPKKRTEPSIEAEAFGAAMSAGSVVTYRPRITFQDTNIVGNVYFLTYFRWQNECREKWLRSYRPPAARQLGDGQSQLVTLQWSTRFEDSFGATIGDDITVSFKCAEVQPSQFSATAEIRRSIRGESSPTATGSMLFATDGRSAEWFNDHPCGPCYSFVVEPFASEDLNPLELLSWQGKCRESFLADHAHLTLELVAEQKLVLQTTMASLDLVNQTPVAPGEVCVEMRLDTLKCGQMGVRFDYFAVIPDHGRVRFAKGYQRLSSKRRKDLGLVACALPTDLLKALSQFAGTESLLAKIEDVLAFSEDISPDLHRRSIAAHSNPK